MMLQIAAAYGEPLGTRAHQGARRSGGRRVRVQGGRTTGACVRPRARVGDQGGIGLHRHDRHGHAAIEYFEDGADVRGLATKLRETKERMLEKVRARGGAEEPPIAGARLGRRRRACRACRLVLDAAWEEGGQVAAVPGEVTGDDLWPRVEPLLARSSVPRATSNREWGARHDPTPPTAWRSSIPTRTRSAWRTRRSRSLRDAQRP